jgi:hypothetical protein
MCIAWQSQAQSQRPFWNVETNPSVYSYTIVRFYAADRRLLGEERIEKKIDIGRRRILGKLDRKLSAYVLTDSLKRLAQNKGK